MYFPTHAHTYMCRSLWDHIYLQQFQKHRWHFHYVQHARKQQHANLFFLVATRTHYAPRGDVAFKGATMQRAVPTTSDPPSAAPAI